MTARKRIFLLGGTGFIGSALTRQLLADRANTQLMMLIHRTAPLRELEQVDTSVGSLPNFDLALLDRFRPEVVLHLARMGGRGRLGRSLAAWRGARANRRIIRHLKQSSLSTRTVYVSGTLVYGDNGGAAVDEETPIKPTAFAREYIRAEEPWMREIDKEGLPVTIVRPPWIIGSGSWFAAYYLRSIRNDRFVPLFGAGQNLMSLLDVEDCAGLIQHAARSATAGRYHNLFAPGACLTQQEFAERLAQRTGVAVKRFDDFEVARRFGRAAAEAFTFSCKCDTRYPEFIAGFRFRSPSVDLMLRNHVPAELWA